MNKNVTTVSVERCLEALGHVTRRRLLLSLLNDSTNGRLAVDLDQVDPDASEDALSLFMHHVHLPKLEESGLIEVDRDQRAATRGPRFAEIEPLLELLDENQEQLPGNWV